MARARILRLLSAALLSLAAAPLALADLAVVPGSLTIDPNQNLLEGQIVQLVASVGNRGRDSLIGTAQFLIDGRQVGTDQPVSVRAGGSPDEVFVSWRATAGEYRLSFRINPFDPGSDSPANNSAELNFSVDRDTDGDSIGDSVDPDDDNDSIADTDELARGLDPLRADSDGDGFDDARDIFPLDSRDWQDADGDGLGDNADPDSDGDGLPNPAESAIGTDYLKADSDGDGVNDLLDQFPLDPKESRDSDGDGVGDTADAFPDNSKEFADCDRDSVGNNSDPDDDNDGTPDSVDALPCEPTEIANFDGDGTGDNADTDDDNDGAPDDRDAFPFDPAEQRDSDRDGLGDAADPFDDNAGPIISVEIPVKIVRGQLASFDAAATRDPDGSIREIRWQFGDASPEQVGQQASHTFSRLGRYQIRVIAIDDRGESREQAFGIEVANPPYLDYFLAAIFVLLLGGFGFVIGSEIRRRTTSPSQPAAPAPARVAPRRRPRSGRA